VSPPRSVAESGDDRIEQIRLPKHLPPLHRGRAIKAERLREKLPDYRRNKYQKFNT
jgi:hypothetical protein